MRCGRRTTSCGVSEEELRRRLALADEDDWASAATRDWIGRVAPDSLRDADALRWYTSYVRRGASPGAAKALRLMNAEIDVRDLLPTISVPTLVLHRARESWRDGSRFMGEHIPGAHVVELPGNDHLPWEGDAESSLDEIERFLAGVRDEVEPDRVLATLLFTDIAGSTAKAAELGDRAWQDLLTKHRRLVRAQLARFRGREVDMAGDGVFATFDGPARAVRCASAIARRARGARPRRAGGRAHGRDRAGERRRARGRSPHRRANRRSGRGRVRCWCRARSRTSSPARASPSRSAASTSWTACQAPGASSPRGSDHGLCNRCRVRHPSTPAVPR